MRQRKKQESNNLKKGILLVEDDEVIRELLKSFLDDDNQVVTVASSGEEALALFKDQLFRLVISDVRMPGMGGIQLLIQIKKIDATIDVIMLTAFDDIETYHEAMSCGAAEYIYKPASLNEIKQVVQNYLSQSKRSYLIRIKSKLRGLRYACQRKIKKIYSTS